MDGKPMNEPQILKSIILPRRPPKNAEVSLNEGGDCGALCLAGLLGLPDAAAAYEYHCPGDYYGGTPIPKIHHFTRDSMVRTLEALVSDSMWRSGPTILDHVISDVPIWPFGYAQHYLCFGMQAQSEWRDYARAMLNGGYYGIAQVKHGGYGENEVNRGHTDHWVMICGWRYVYTPETDPERIKIGSLGSYHEEFLIGDSSRARPLETWVDANEFQERWGGFAAIWARPIGK
jgi:hypothetical protein